MSLLDKAEGVFMIVMVGVAGYAAYRLFTTSPGKLASGVVGAAAEAVNGATTATVGAVSTAVGLPTPDETETDPAIGRFLIDTLGYFTASQWTSVSALIGGGYMDTGSGKPPAHGRPVWRALNEKGITEANVTSLDLGGSDGGAGWDTDYPYDPPGMWG